MSAKNAFFCIKTKKCVENYETQEYMNKDKQSLAEKSIENLGVLLFPFLILSNIIIILYNVIAVTSKLYFFSCGRGG